MAAETTNFPQIGAPFTDPKTGKITEPWYWLLAGLFKATGSGAPTAPPTADSVLTWLNM
jgi:hypothetical protein